MRGGGLHDLGDNHRVAVVEDANGDQVLRFSHTGYAPMWTLTRGASEKVLELVGNGTIMLPEAPIEDATQQDM